MTSDPAGTAGLGGEVCVGVEGGGTHATALALNAEGAPVARRVGAAALISSRDPIARVPELDALVRSLVKEAGARPPVAGLCCALAGVGRERVRLAVEGALEQAGLARRVRVVTDAEAALYDAFGDGPGLLLVSGTGSIAWGRRADGRPARVGGWGILLGDEGSGYAMGLAGLRAVVRASDGRGPPTALAGAILAKAAAQEAAELIGWTDGATKAQIAAVAPLVLAAAETDATARAILEEAAAHLAAHVSALIARLAPWDSPPQVALAGGLLAPGRGFRAVVERSIRAREPACVILPDPVDGARGAANLARALAAAN